MSSSFEEMIQDLCLDTVKCFHDENKPLVDQIPNFRPLLFPFSYMYILCVCVCVCVCVRACVRVRERVFGCWLVGGWLSFIAYQPLKVA